MSSLKHAWTNLAMPFGSLLAQEAFKLGLSVRQLQPHTIKEIFLNSIGGNQFINLP